MPIQKSTPSPFYKKPLFFIALALVLLAAGAGAYYYVLRGDDTKSSVRPPNNVSYDTPTEEERQETEEFKEQQEKGNSPAPAPATPPTAGKQAVKPTISYAGQYDASIEASAFIPSIFEDGGTCTLTLKNGAATVTKTSQSAKDARTTRCALFNFPAKELSPAGKWTATVSYVSATSAGTSDAVEFEVK